MLSIVGSIRRVFFKDGRFLSADMSVGKGRVSRDLKTSG